MKALAYFALLTIDAVLEFPLRSAEYRSAKVAQVRQPTLVFLDSGPHIP